MNLKCLVFGLFTLSSIGRANQSDQMVWFSDSNMNFDTKQKHEENFKSPKSDGKKEHESSSGRAKEAAVKIKDSPSKYTIPPKGSVFRVRGYSATLVSIRPLDEGIKKGLSPHECKELYIAEFQPDSNLRMAILNEMKFPNEANASLPETLRWIFGGRRGCFLRNRGTQGQDTLESLDEALRQRLTKLE